MGDQVDGLDLPLHEQSGNMSRGQISELNQRELQEQSGALDQVLEPYYRGDINFNQVLTEITNLGYTDDRARQIRQAAQTERTIRFQTGHPSELTPNQLNFLERNHRSMLNAQFQIHTDPDGRQYVDDPRVREVDGTPSKLYLPDPVPFNPLTIAQQEEQQRRLDNARPDFLEDFAVFEDPPPPFAETRLDTDFNNRDRSIIHSQASDYLNDPTPENLATLRENLGLFIRPNTIRNQNEVLNQFMIDIQYEAQFRQQNNGRPQLLSEEQFNLMNGRIPLSQGQRVDWDGGLIYENEDGELYYRDSRTGRERGVPNIDEFGVITFPYLASQINLPPSITDNYVGQFSPETYDPTFNIRHERQPLSPADQERLQRDIADAINGGKDYRAFLVNLQNNYELSNQQFIDASLAVAERDNSLSYEDIIATQAYVDSPLYFYTDEQGNERFTTSEQTYTNIALSRGIDQSVIDTQIRNFNNDFQVSHTAIQTSLTVTPIIQPSLNVLEQIRLGLTTQEDLNNRFLERPRPFIDSQGILNQLGRAEAIRQEQLPEREPGPIQYDALGEPLLTNFTNQDVLDFIDDDNNTNQQIDALLNLLPPEQLTDEILDRARSRGATRNIFQEGSGSVPVVPGTTIPIVGGEEQPVPLPAEQVRRYEQYFNSQQNQFTPFRNMFRDILPIFSGAIGGYFAFSLARSRERGTIQEIINQERAFLDNLQLRIENDIELLDDVSFRARSSNVFDPIRDPDNDPVMMTIEMTPLRNLPTALRTERLELEQRAQAGTGEFEFLTGPAQVNFLRDQLKSIDEAITQAESDLDSLEMDIASETIQRDEINNRLDRLLEFDREILRDVHRYNPQILFGFSIGQTLGLALSGYFFPTYVDIDDNDEFMKADNINYNPDFVKKQKEEREKRKKSKPKPLKDLQAGKITAGEGTISRRQQPIIRSFIPTRNSFASQAGRPLSYQQIQDYKSTLSQSELNNLKGKMLIFGENKKVYKEENICKSVQGSNIINKIPIKI